MNSEKMRKIWKKIQLSSEEIWKKSKLNSENMEEK